LEVYVPVENPSGANIDDPMVNITVSVPVLVSVLSPIKTVDNNLSVNTDFPSKNVEYESPTLEVCAPVENPSVAYSVDPMNNNTVSIDNQSLTDVLLKSVTVPVDPNFTFLPKINNLTGPTNSKLLNTPKEVVFKDTILDNNISTPQKLTILKRLHSVSPEEPCVTTVKNGKTQCDSKKLKRKNKKSINKINFPLSSIQEEVSSQESTPIIQ